ncbi:hypothetical protein [Pseudodesulfovibrio senegalensis]|uniref:Uncharacterized protein n=1 Tax=Pseudodesulfovibrio senegalensis TaxID=1721087 RepID=A0A6N6N2C4_9BACT|nr:hypothetical protein [Pseudodesulfovibrio senegalensis]KAB1440341.1 hypothetical protein F8A88_13915 [Pseudodesulfovibrio senegalensis]
MTQICPEDCMHSHVDPWWVEADSNVPEPGRLLWVYVPHVGQEPMALVPTGRADDARQHALADCKIMPANHEEVFQRSKLPVAGLPCYDREMLSVYRAKRRPALVLAAPHVPLDREEFKGKPSYMTAATYMIAPYYGVEEGTGKRAGYPATFMERVRHGEYPQFFWDSLPVGNEDESILRLDQIYPLSTMFRAFELTDFKLSEAALAVIQEWMEWHFFTEVRVDGLVQYFHETFAE